MLNMEIDNTYKKTTWINETYPIMEKILELYPQIGEENAKKIEKSKIDIYANMLFLEFHKNKNENNDYIILPVKFFLKNTGFKELEEEIYKKIGKEVAKSVEKVIRDGNNINLLSYQKKILEKYLDLSFIITETVNFNLKLSENKKSSKNIREIVDKEYEIINKIKRYLDKGKISKALETLYIEIHKLKEMNGFEEYNKKINKIYEWFFKRNI